MKGIREQERDIHELSDNKGVVWTRNWCSAPFIPCEGVNDEKFIDEFLKGDEKFICHMNSFVTPFNDEKFI